jgi:opacity protein-like surface antigen
MKKIITTFVVSLFLFTSNAISADLSSLSIGLAGSKAAYYALGEETNRNESGTIKTRTKEAGAFEDSYASVFAELAVNDIVSFGVDYVVSDIHTPTNTTNDDRATPQTASATFSDLTTIYAKINTTLWGTYLKVGHVSVDISINENSSRSFSDTSTNGYQVGLGIEKEATDGVSIRAEVTATQFDDVSTDNGIATTGNRNDYDVTDMIGARGTIALVKSF